MIRHTRFLSLVSLSLVVAGSLATLGAAGTAQAAPAEAARQAAPTGQLQLIQGVPGLSAAVSVDGEEVDSGLDVGAVAELDLAPGSHEVVFTADDGSSAMVDVDVAAGATDDVVFHLPAAVGGDPVVSTYEAPTGAIGPGKARVLVAHTATVAPADVVVDGQTVFNDIANGEFAEAEVPAGSLSVALVASSGEGEPLLGPLDVTLKAETVTRVYAVGQPADGTMQLITRTADLSADGTVVPDAIDTGSAGLAADLPVAPFGSVTLDPVSRSGSAPWLWAAFGAVLLLAGAAGAAGPGRRIRGWRLVRASGAR